MTLTKLDARYAEAVRQFRKIDDWAAFDAAMAEMGKGTGAWSPDFVPDVVNPREGDV